ncbi:hypothetical protein [Bradyrhizobium sp. CCBAU 53338]|uniref:hypothetical protein n=1 Tax=Bradyrhizobium sp. CCBAU 53338 TaxID=1325111 RepID=UPI00188CCDE6|nr:hypothetical protein [Bradyrhizobium sp. CCBAU 53338]QOZ55154.1 hypothetical protein XH90_30030 [Bradyrhizobium sp. CCBAU 53338]
MARSRARALWSLRKQIGALAERILELSFGGATVKFGQLLEKGTEILDEAKPLPAPDLPSALEEKYEMPPVTAPAPEIVPPPAIPVAPVQRAAPLSTGDGSSESVFNAFEGVNDALQQLSEALQIRSRGGALIVKLVKAGHIPMEAVDLYETLRKARNAIAHGEAQIPNAAEALEFARQASSLRGLLMYALEAVNAEKHARTSR